MEIDKENVKGFEYVLPYGDKSIKERLNELKPGQAMVINYESALKKSVGVKPTLRNIKIERVDMSNIKKWVVSLLAVGVIVASSVSVHNYINTPNMNDVSMALGASVMEKNSHSIEHVTTIANQNIGIGENGTHFYYHDAIARDLLKVDPSMFEYALCTVCNDFGKNINNKVGFGGRSNIDAVIYYLKEYSSNQDGGFYNADISNFFEDVDSFKDFLVKRGFVDKDGGPSMEAFREECDKNTQSIYDILQSEANDRGVKK